MPSASVETHSIETGPSTMEEIFLMATSGSAWPAFEMSVGFVVTPPSTPQLAASSISEISAVSRDRIMSISLPFRKKSYGNLRENRGGLTSRGKVGRELNLFPAGDGMPFPGGTS